MMLYGSPFAINRFERYKSSIRWKHHSDYFGYEIIRAYHIENDKPCALYGCKVESVFAVAESLDRIKDTVKARLKDLKEGSA